MRYTRNAGILGAGEHFVQLIGDASTWAMSLIRGAKLVHRLRGQVTASLVNPADSLDALQASLSRCAGDASASTGSPDAGDFRPTGSALDAVRLLRAAVAMERGDVIDAAEALEKAGQSPGAELLRFRLTLIDKSKAPASSTIPRALGALPPIYRADTEAQWALASGKHETLTTPVGVVLPMTALRLHVRRNELNEAAAIARTACTDRLEAMRRAFPDDPASQIVTQLREGMLAYR